MCTGSSKWHVECRHRKSTFSTRCRYLRDLVTGRFPDGDNKFPHYSCPVAAPWLEHPIRTAGFCSDCKLKRVNGGKPMKLQEIQKPKVVQQTETQFAITDKDGKVTTKATALEENPPKLSPTKEDMERGSRKAEQEDDDEYLIISSDDEWSLVEDDEEAFEKYLVPVPAVFA